MSFRRAAAAARSILERPGGMSVADFDAVLRDAFAGDARETAENICAAITGRESPADAVRTRTYSVLSAVGPLDIQYRYAPGSGGFAQFRKRFGAGTRGDIKATRTVRTAIARAGAQLGSFAEASRFLGDVTYLPVSAGTVRKATLRAGAKTENAWKKKKTERTPAAVPSKRPAPGAVRVEPTVAVSIDGTGVPCVKADTRGAAGKDGQTAHTRELKVMWAAWYEYVDKYGRPLPDPSRTYMRVTSGPASEAEAKLLVLAEMAGYGKAARTQFVGDGAVWIENMHDSSFFESEKTVDFYHACGYLHTLISAVAPAGRTGQMFGKYRKMLMTKSGGHVCDTFRKRHADSIGNLPEEAAKALRYLETRRDAMNYGWLAKNGYYLGSGCIESACRYLVAARCKQAGMHWRIKNAVRIATLRATIRSHMKIIA